MLYLHTGEALYASYTFYMLEYHLSCPPAIPSIFFFLISVNAISLERAPTIQIILTWLQLSLPLCPVLIVSPIELIAMCAGYVFVYLITMCPCQIPEPSRAISDFICCPALSRILRIW